VSDGYSLDAHANQLRRVAHDLGETLPEGDWGGPAHLECRLRMSELQHSLQSIARTLDSVSVALS
jgi:hypothetical protein